MSSPMSEIRKAVVLNMYLMRHNLLVRNENDWKDFNKQASNVYFNDVNFQNYCEIICSTIYGHVNRLENEVAAIRAELDGADKVIKNLKET